MEAADNRSMQEALEAERQRLDKRMADREEEQRQLHMTTNEALQLRIKKLEEEQAQWMAQDAELDEQLQQSISDFQQNAQKAREFQSNFPKKDKHMVKRGFWHLSWRCQICKNKAELEGRWMCPDCGHVQQNIY